MLMTRPMTSFLAVAGFLGGGFLMQEPAEAAHCASGQIYRVSQKSCVSRSSAAAQGIIGSGRRSFARQARNSRIVAEEAPKPAATKVAGTQPTDPVERQAPPARPEPSPMPARASAYTDVAPTGSIIPVAATAPVAPPAPSRVKIEVVRTGPSPVPEILMPNWPFGELPAFPKRSRP